MDSPRLAVSARKYWLLLAALPLASGAALLIHILAGISLGLALLGMGLLVVCAGWLIWQRLTPVLRVNAAQRVLFGLAAGVLATLAYDGSRWVFVTVFHDTFWPFDVFPIFGYAIAGTGISHQAALLIGTAYHYTNGLLFAVAYTLLFGPRNWWIGILWALGLEALMLSVYPGWLHPKAYSEFVSVSIFGHVAYGSVLGLVSQQGLRWLGKRQQQ